MDKCLMPQGHPTRCGCTPSEPDPYANPVYCRSLEQDRNFLRVERNEWVSKWGKAVSYGEALELQRDLLLAALEALLEHEGTVDHTGIGDFPSEALQAARRQAMAAINSVKQNSPRI